MVWNSEHVESMQQVRSQVMKKTVVTNGSMLRPKSWGYPHQILRGRLTVCRKNVHQCGIATDGVGEQPSR